MVELHFLLVPLDKAEGEQDRGSAVFGAVCRIICGGIGNGFRERLDRENGIRLMLPKQIDVPHIFRPLLLIPGGSHGEGKLCQLVGIVPEPGQKGTMELFTVGLEGCCIQAFVTKLKIIIVFCFFISMLLNDLNRILGCGSNH